MKIYIASSFKLIDRVLEIAEALEADGHTITEKWYDRSYHFENEGLVHTTELKTRYDELSPEEFYAIPSVKQSFLKDFLGVKKADALVFVADDQPRKFNGAAVELGIALGDFKPCFLLGELETSVLYSPLRRCRDTVQLLAELDQYRRRMRMTPMHSSKEALL